MISQAASITVPPLAAAFTTQVSAWLWLIVPGLVLLLALAIGVKDVLRLSTYRIRAIATVCFAESMRRRVLLITPVAMLGVLVVAQLQHPADEQDAIRQTLKFCLFAAGLVGVLSVVILACSSIPREIENRVIFTVVTKPTTRLEIVLGKILGFTGVSATVLLLMGLFTWGYVELRATRLEANIAATLDENRADPTARPALEHFRRVGLLTAARNVTPRRVEVLSEIARKGVDPAELRWLPAGPDGDVAVPFSFDPNATIYMLDGEAGYSPAGMVLTLKVAARPNPKAATKSLVVTRPSETKPKQAPAVQIQVLDENFNLVLDGRSFSGGQVQIKPDGSPVSVGVAVQNAAEIAKRGRVYVTVTAVNPDWQYAVGNDPVHLAVIGPDRKSLFLDLPPAGDPDVTGRSALIFRGRDGRGGQQLRGQQDGEGPVSVYAYRNVDLSKSAGESVVPFEFVTTVERSGGDAENEALTEVRFTFVNTATGFQHELTANPESKRSLFLEVPRQAVDGGNFDVRVSCRSSGHWITTNAGDLVVVAERQHFVSNLLRSLLVLWLLTVLVICISVFCSTFLSWPIAVVLTIVILLGRWGVTQLGDALEPGVGRQIVSSAGVQDPRYAQVLSKSVEGLASILKTTAAFLPDIERFEATGPVERGELLPLRAITGSLQVLGLFGLPLTGAAYLIFRRKEVAP